MTVCAPCGAHEQGPEVFQHRPLLTFDLQLFGLALANRFHCPDSANRRQRGLRASRVRRCRIRSWRLASRSWAFDDPEPVSNDGQWQQGHGGALAARLCRALPHSSPLVTLDGDQPSSATHVREFNQCSTPVDVARDDDCPSSIAGPAFRSKMSPWRVSRGASTV